MNDDFYQHGSLPLTFSLATLIDSPKADFRSEWEKIGCTCAPVGGDWRACPYHGNPKADEGLSELFGCPVFTVRGLTPTTAVAMGLVSVDDQGNILDVGTIKNIGTKP